MKPLSPKTEKVDLFKPCREKVKKIIQEKIEYFSKHYKTYGFWKDEDNKTSSNFIYFPSVEAAKDWYEKALAYVPYETYRKQKVKRCDYYNDGDKLSLDQDTEYTVKTEIEYDSDGPHAVVMLYHYGLETLEEIAERIWSTIVTPNARKEYIKTLDK